MLAPRLLRRIVFLHLPNLLLLQLERRLLSRGELLGRHGCIRKRVHETLCVAARAKGEPAGHTQRTTWSSFRPASISDSAAGFWGLPPLESIGWREE